MCLTTQYVGSLVGAVPHKMGFQVKKLTRPFALLDSVYMHHWQASICIVLVRLTGVSSGILAHYSCTYALAQAQNFRIYVSQ